MQRKCGSERTWYACSSSSKPKPAPARPSWPLTTLRNMIASPLPRCAQKLVRVRCSVCVYGSARLGSLRARVYHTATGQLGIDCMLDAFRSLWRHNALCRDDYQEVHGLEHRGRAHKHQHPQPAPRGRRRATGAWQPGEAGLPQPDILGRLIDAMRTTPRGVVGWRLCPAKLDRQPAFLAWVLLAQRTAAATPHAQSVHMRCVHATTRID